MAEKLVANQLDPIDTDPTLAANSDEKVPSQKAIKAYIEARFGSIGRFLSDWDCETGLPTTDPETSPYTYKSGDHFIVSNVGTTNYRPSGTTYVSRQPSTTVETAAVKVRDLYYFDSTSWVLIRGSDVEVSFANLGGQPTDNEALSQALDAKQNTISDLATIRSGAALGATALQSITSLLIINALGYTPYNGTTNPNGFINYAAIWRTY